MRILIVDDDRFSREVFKKELKQGGYEIIEATDGFEALHVIHEQDVDLVTLDIEMPDMDGYQVCSWLRSEQFSMKINKNNFALLPIIFVTSNNSLEYRMKGFRAGATDFISKGFKPGELLATVNNILSPENFMAGLKAIVVDDSAVVLKSVTRMLQEQGVIVYEATNGLDAFEILKARTEDIDMVITDWEMPVMKGDELCRRIRKDLGLKDLPVIFLTANPNRSALVELFEAGATDYLVKPFLKEELLARLRVTQEVMRTLEQEVAERKRAQETLEVTKKLADAQADAAGKAEMATSILHNIGNVLNSVNVSCAQMDNTLKTSIISQILLALKLMDKNKEVLGDFLTKDNKGRKLPEYLALAAKSLEAEHQQLVEETSEMRKKIQLMGDIINSQQNRARIGSGARISRLKDLVEEALKVQEDALSNFNIKLEKDLNSETLVKVRENDLMHILINLIKNAVEAMREVSERKLKLTSKQLGNQAVVLEIKDSGMGISAENLKNIFSMGFTTKEDGHGFGLNYCAKAMEEMGGKIEVTSEGPGQGAVFSLTIPGK